MKNTLVKMSRHLCATLKFAVSKVITVRVASPLKAISCKTHLLCDRTHKVSGGECVRISVHVCTYGCVYEYDWGGGRV